MVEAPPERRDDEIVLAPLDRQVANLDRRQPAAKTRPTLAAVRRHEEPELRAM
jgi:hypothetical protein